MYCGSLLHVAGVSQVEKSRQSSHLFSPFVHHHRHIPAVRYWRALNASLKEGLALPSISRCSLLDLQGRRRELPTWESKHGFRMRLLRPSPSVLAKYGSGQASTLRLTLSWRRFTGFGEFMTRFFSGGGSSLIFVAGV